jgi:hypothetical protein
LSDPYTPEQLGTVKDQVTAPPVGTGPDPSEMAAKIPAGTPTAVDVPALLAQMQAQQEAMAAEIARLKAGQAPEGEHPLIGTALQTRDLIATHVDMGGGKNRGPVILRLADDVIDAARNAVSSGDTGPVRQLAQRLERALNQVHPGPGDHHYFTLALQGAGVHMQDAADAVTGPAPSSAGAVGSSQPAARVISGSVTG